jgi:hypothetical protein
MSWANQGQDDNPFSAPAPAAAPTPAPVAPPAAAPADAPSWLSGSQAPSNVPPAAATPPMNQPQTSQKAMQSVATTKAGHMGPVPAVGELGWC